MKSNNLELFKTLIEAFEAMPGIGSKSALKLAYHIVTDSKYEGVKLSHAIENAVQRVRRCIKCNNLSEDELCHICSNKLRDTTKVCIVQSAKDIFTIEKVGQYDGLYYVISDIEEFDLAHLKEALSGSSEIIFAFAPSIASDTMILYIESQLENFNSLRFTKIAQGVPTGVSLDNVDTLSLAKALEDRVNI